MDINFLNVRIVGVGFLRTEAEQEVEKNTVTEKAHLMAMSIYPVSKLLGISIKNYKGKRKEYIIQW